MRFDEYNLLGMRDGMLEMCRTTTTGKEPLYYYEQYRRCDDYDIDDVIANGIELSEVNKRFEEWLRQQQLNNQQ